MQSASDEHWKSPDCTTIITAFCSLGHFLTHIDNSFIHSGYLYSSPSRHLLRGALSPATAKEKCLYHGCCLYIRCFAIDESGFIIIHKDFGTGLPTGSLHIAAREPAVSSDLILGGSLID